MNASGLLASEAARLGEAALLGALPLLRSGGAVLFTGLAEAYAGDGGYPGPVAERYSGAAVYNASAAEAWAGPKGLLDALVDVACVNERDHAGALGQPPFRDPALRAAALAMRSLECWPDACLAHAAQGEWDSAGSRALVPPEGAFAQGSWQAAAWGAQPVPDKVSYHDYGAAYERYLAPYRGRAVVRVLEIGLGCGMRYGEGASAPVWRAYFGAALELTFVEFNAACGDAWAASPAAQGARVYAGDQRNATLLALVAAERGPFHVIVDDGGHSPEMQVVSLSALFPSALVPGGAYFVEGIHISHTSGGLSAIAHLLDVSDAIVAKGAAWSTLALQTRLDSVSAEARAVARAAEHINFFAELAVLVRAG